MPQGAGGAGEPNATEPPSCACGAPCPGGSSPRQGEASARPEASGCAGLPGRSWVVRCKRGRLSRWGSGHRHPNLTRSVTPGLRLGTGKDSQDTCPARIASDPAECRQASAAQCLRSRRGFALARRRTTRTRRPTRAARWFCRVGLARPTRPLRHQPRRSRAAKPPPQNAETPGTSDARGRSSAHRAPSPAKRGEGPCLPGPPHRFSPEAQRRGKSGVGIKAPGQFFRNGRWPSCARWRPGRQPAGRRGPAAGAARRARGRATGRRASCARSRGSRRRCGCGR